MLLQCCLYEVKRLVSLVRKLQGFLGEGNGRAGGRSHRAEEYAENYRLLAIAQTIGGGFWLVVCVRFSITCVTYHEKLGVYFRVCLGCCVCSLACLFEATELDIMASICPPSRVISCLQTHVVSSCALFTQGWYDGNASDTAFGYILIFDITCPSQHHKQQPYRLQQIQIAQPETT